MTRWLVAATLLCLGSLSVGAAPLPVTLEPAQPTFGKTVTVIVALPNDVVPAGLPVLEPFAPLSAPTVQNNQYRLELLPLRSGTFTLPSLPFQRGQSEHFRTAPLTIEVSDDIPLDAAVVPPPKPEQGAAPLTQIVKTTIFVLLLATGVLVLIGSSRRHPPILNPPSLSSSNGDELLAELHRRVRDDHELTATERQTWCSRLDAARFSSPETRLTTARHLLAIYLQEIGRDE